ncbi:MAG: hypothetical protein N2999_02005 [Proteobacteria bacterium]|nr:hypothetical protein [Pseudomonadota bacterium]
MKNKVDSKVSNILLIRRNILEYLKEVEYSKDIDLETLERVGEYFLRYEELVTPILIEELEKKEGTKTLNKFEYLLKYLDNPNLVRPLIDALIRNKDKTKLKTTILRVLKYYNVDFSLPPLNQFHSELQIEVDKMAHDLIQSYNENWYKFRDTFFDFCYSEDSQINILRLIEKSEDKRKYGVLSTMLLTNNHNLITSVIETLGRSYDEEALEVLKRALIFLPVKYHNLVELNLRKLSFKNVKGADYLCEENSIELCYMSFPFSSDMRQIMYITKKDSNYILILIEIETEKGVGENCIFYFLQSFDEAKRMAETFIRNLNLKEVTNGYDIKMINSAIFFNYVNDYRFTPYFSVLLNFLPSYYFKPVLYSSDKIREKFQVTGDREWLLKNSDKLWYLTDKLGWLSEDYQFRSIVDRWYGNTKKEEHLWMDELLIKKVLREIILSDINNWKNKLLFLADFLDNINYKREYIEMIMAVYDEFTKDIEKMEKIPFIRKLILESKEMALLFLI